MFGGIGGNPGTFSNSVMIIKVFTETTEPYKIMASFYGLSSIIFSGTKARRVSQLQFALVPMATVSMTWNFRPQ